MKISFIVPVYNVELYLKQCVDSILCQSYKDIEVILVNDGSTDKSPEICESYAEKDHRVRVLHKPNGGLSDARNRGLSLATGEYVVFIDSDDFWIGEESLQKLVCVVNENPDCDFIGFNCSYFYPYRNAYTKWVPYNERLECTLSKDVAIPLLVESGTFPMSACLKLISRSFLNEKGLYFKVGTIAEDIPWFIDLLDASEKCLFVNMYIYAYRQNVQGSITQTKSERVYYDLLNILKGELEKIESRELTDKSRNALFSFLAYEYCILLSNLSSISNSSVQRKELYKYKWLLNYSLNPKVKKASCVFRLFGIRMTELVLRFYNKRRAAKS